MTRYRYSHWDGSQSWDDLQGNEVMDAISDDLMAHGDLWRALRNLLQRGMRTPSGQRLPGLQELLQRLRNQRQQQLDRFNLGSIFDEIKERLKDVTDTERQGIENRLKQARGESPPEQGRGGEGSAPPSPQSQAGAGTEVSGRGEQDEGGPRGEGSQRPDENLLKMLEDIAQRKLSFLDGLPEDVPAQIKALSDYEFMDPQAHQKFQELMDLLKGQVMDAHFRNIQQALQDMTPEQLQRLREMMADLNRMLQQRMRGQEPDFDAFMQKYGDMFGPNPPQSLDELIERMQRQRAAMQSLLDSMSPQMRQSLQQMVEEMTQGMGLTQEAALLAANLDELLPMGQWQNEYPFRGDQPLSLSEALRLMDQLQSMDELDKQLRAAQHGYDLDNIDAERLRELLGEEAAQELEQLKRLTEMLEEAGYIVRKGNRFELTPRGMRRIGQKALRDIFGYLKRSRFGKHHTHFRGAGTDQADDTKKYEFGDPFQIHLERTLMNALQREGPGRPVPLNPDDFEVYRTEYLTQAATVLMLDLSWSMPLRGNFLAAKKVALALDSLIRGQFPRDNLYIVGFSDYARELKKEHLPQLSWNEFVYGTNMHHGFMLSRKLLSRHKGATRQIIMITDGEPTAHLEGGRAHFAYPPTYRTIQETLKEVKRCTKEGIIINTFMLERSPYLREFVDQITRINKGRAFYTSADRLGEYILVDYLANKRKRIVG